MFVHKITPDGIFVDGLTKSRLAQKSADALKVIPFSNFKKIFAARQELDDETRELGKIQEYISENHHDIR